MCVCVRVRTCVCVGGGGGEGYISISQFVWEYNIIGLRLVVRSKQAPGYLLVYTNRN